MTPQLKIQEIFLDKKRKKTIKSRISRDIINLFEHEEKLL